PRRAQRADGLPARVLGVRPDPRRQGAPVCRRRRAGGDGRAVCILQDDADRQGHPGLRRQPPRRAGRRPERQAPVRAHLRPGLGLPRGRRLRDGDAGGGQPGAGARLYAARVRDRDRRRPGLDGRRAARRRTDRRLGGARRPLHRALREEHVQFCAPDPGAAVPPAGLAGQENMNRRAVVLLAMLGIFLLLLPQFAGAYVLSVATLILFFAYTGQAWNVMMGFAGQLSLGHSLYVGVAAYAAAGLFFHYGIGPWAGLWLAILLCMLLGMLIGFLAFRFSISGVYFALLTIAFAEFTRIGFDHIDWLGGPGGLFLKVAQRDSIDLANFRGPPAMYYYAILSLCALAFVGCFFLLRSKAGYYWQAIRENEEAAQALGINTFRWKMLAVAISAAMTSISGVFFAFYYNNLFPEQVFNITRSIEIILGPVIGGVGTLFGPILGAVLLTALSDGLTDLLAALGWEIPGIKQVLYGVVL